MEAEVDIQEQQLQQEPDPPKKKLWKSLSDKHLYTKSYEDFGKQFSTPESIDKLHKVLSEKELYTKTTDDFKSQFFPDLSPDVKKKVGRVDLEGSSMEAGNVLSQSNGVGGEKIPTVEMYNLPNGEMVEADPISLSKKYNELKDRKKEISTGTGSSFTVGTGSTLVDDEEAQKSAKKLREDFKDTDLEGIHEETKDLSEGILANHGKRLMQERNDNPNLYQRDLANLKWRSGFEKQLLDDVDKGNIHPEEYNQIKHSIEQLPIATGQGDYSNQREAIKSLSSAIQIYGGENKDKLLKDFAVEVSKVYGNPDNKATETFKDTPESKYLNEDEQLAYQYKKDVDPEGAKQYERILIDPKTLKDDPDALRAANHLHQTLEETAIGLQENYVQEELNNLKKISIRDNGLSPESLAKADKLQEKQNELAQKRNELDKKYPERFANKVDDAVQEVLGQKVNWLARLNGKLTTGVGHTIGGMWDLVSQPFKSDASNNLTELGIMGAGIREDRMFHLTDENKAIQDSKLIIEPGLQAEVDAIKNDKNLSDVQKESIIRGYFQNNPDKFGRVPIQGGKFNPSLSSILTAVGDVTTSLAPFVMMEAATGGIGGAGTLAKMARTANAAFTTGFYDHLAEGISQGKTGGDLYKFGVVSTLIDAMAVGGAQTAAEVRAMAGNKTSASKMLATLSDKEIESQLAKELPKSVKVFGRDIAPYLQKAKDRIAATPKMFAEGVKTGGKFELANTIASEAKHQIFNTEIDRELNLKHSILGGATFGIIGAGLGHLNYKAPNELQRDFLVKFGENPESFHAVNEQMKKDGEVTPVEYDHRKILIDKSAEAYKSLPTANAKGKPLSEKEKGEYMYNTVVKNEGKNAASNLPPKQAEKAEMTALVADHKNDLILDPKTDKQLLDTQKKLQAQLEKKDENGKSELNDKERLNVQAELEAVNDAIKNKKDTAEQLPNLSVPIEGTDKKGVPVGEDVPEPTEPSTPQVKSDGVVDKASNVGGDVVGKDFAFSNFSRGSIPYEKNEIADKLKNNERSEDINVLGYHEFEDLLNKVDKTKPKDIVGNHLFDKPNAVVVNEDGNIVVKLIDKNTGNVGDKVFYKFKSLEDAAETLHSIKENHRFLQLSTLAGMEAKGKETELTKYGNPTVVKNALEKLGIEVPQSIKDKIAEQSLSKQESDVVGSEVEGKNIEWVDEHPNIAMNMEFLGKVNGEKIGTALIKKEDGYYYHVGGKEVKIPNQARAEKAFNEFKESEKERFLSENKPILNEEPQAAEVVNPKEETGNPVTEPNKIEPEAEEETGEGKVTGVKRAVTDPTRAENNLPKVEFPKMGSDAEALNEAKNRIDSGEVNPQDMVDRILKEKGNYKNEGEVMDMQYYAHQLEKKNQQLSQQLAEAKTPEEEADIRGQKLQLSDLMDAQTEAAQTAGNQWGKTGNRMQPVINDAGLIFRNNKATIKDAYGGEVPKDVQDKLDAITKERDDAIEQRDKVEAQLKQKMAEKGFEEMKKRAAKSSKNKETKESLQKEEQDLLKEIKKSLKKDLGNLNSGLPIPTATLNTLGKLAINYVKQGVNGFEALVDKMYDALKDEGLSRKDIKDFMANYDPLQAEMEAKRLNKKADIIEDKLTPPSVDSKGRPTEPTDFAKPSKVERTFRTHNEWVKANQRVANAEFKMKIEKRKAFESKKNMYQRTLAWAGRLTRLSVLSGYNVLGKLASAATVGSLGKRPVEQIIGGVYSKIFPSIAKKAPIEGQFYWMNAKAEAAFYKDFFNPKKFAKNSWEILRTGSSLLGKRLGSAEYEHVPVLYLPTDLHQIIKDPPKRATFEASFKNGLIWAEKNGLDINDPLVINTIENAAYKRAMYEIFQEQNWLSKKFTSYKSSLEKAGNVGATGKFLVDFMIPVSTVPTNIVRRVITTSPLGLIRGSKEVVDAYRKGIESLTPDQADHVMQQLKQGTLGTALWLIGWYGASQFGGLYSKYNPNKQRKEGELTSDQMAIGGKMIPKPTQHALPLEIIQFAATARHVFDNYVDNKKESTPQAIYAAGMSSIGALLEQVPVIETGVHLVGAAGNPYEAEKLKDDVTRRFEPQILRETGIIPKKEKESTNKKKKKQEKHKKQPKK